MCGINANNDICRLKMVSVFYLTTSPITRQIENWIYYFDGMTLAKTAVLGENPVPVRFVHHKSDTEWPGI